ncbi:hypothetical protein EVU94_13980 [Flavobacteriaceae bacterium 144Ye]|nr:hypothetical protein EVU94_13980 [Flavobacteriaceae bacterium 144Ye]
MITDLIINSGIQFINIPINLTEDITNKIKKSFSEKLIEETDDGDIYDLKEVYYWEQAEVFIDKKTINPEAFTRYGSLNPRDIKREYVELIDEEKIYSISGTEALKVCEKHWIPLPFFRIRQDVSQPFHHGPTSWCRMNIQPLLDTKNNTTHVMTLAFDTNSTTEDNDYNLPRPTDANDNGSERFKCVVESSHAPAFFNDHRLWEWMYNLYWIDEDYAKRYDNELRHVGIYHTLVELLNRINVFPEIGLLSGDNKIDIGLTLDIGNSRTCGLICEKSKPFESTPFDFTTARKLQIRNLSSPHLVYEDPFEMQVAFSEENFGNPVAQEYDNVFNWPSLIRVGPEAVELSSIFESEDSQASLSSPKRYLWDIKPVKVPWIKVDKEGRLGYHDKVNIRENALYGISQFITSEGKFIKESEKEYLMAATESRYSRSSLMMFSIYEILLHTISQINSPDFRKDLGNSTYRRVLKDIVVTCPTAMTLQEQHTLRKAVKESFQLINQTLDNCVDFKDVKFEVFPALPSLDPEKHDSNPWKYDEATCSQIAFLYGELVQKYKSNQNLFFDLNGRYRDNSENKTINIASIDIGGGTTDFMICNYSYDQEAEVPYIKPKPLFWEGFNVAGDDIVKRVIEKVLIPSIHRDIELKNGHNIVSVLNELFGQNLGGQTALNKIYRKQFANLIASPVAYKVFETITNFSGETHTFKLDEVFGKYGEPKSGLIKHINSIISLKTGVDNYDVKNVEILVDENSINSGINDVIGEVLNQLSYLISFFDCDIVLLSGRPSRLPIITQILSSTLNFGVDKVINLGDYRFGNWYPFANSSGYVNDPKSTVCVGALIAYLNQNGLLPGLRFNFENMINVQSTAKYFGIIDYSNTNLRIKETDLLLSPKIETTNLKFYGQPISIGMKQLKSQEWTATPLYMFDFVDNEKKSRLNNQFHFPYHITLRKKSSTGEFIDKSNIEVVDNNGVPIDSHNFKFMLRTSRSFDLHWNDSGSFITRIE